VKYEVKVQCHKGYVRSNMEDSAYLPCGFHGVLEPPFSVAVADGLGGHPGGEYASAIAVKYVKEVVDEMTFKEAMDKASMEIATNHPLAATTITLAVLKDTYADIYWIGDSPAIVIYKSGGSSMVTVPHVNNLGYLTSVLGGFDPTSYTYGHTRVFISEIKALVLATDGLTAHVDPSEVAILYEKGMDFVEVVLSRGAVDNVTVITIVPIFE